MLLSKLLKPTKLKIIFKPNTIKMGTKHIFYKRTNNPMVNTARLFFLLHILFYLSICFYCPNWLLITQMLALLVFICLYVCFVVFYLSFFPSVALSFFQSMLCCCLQGKRETAPFRFRVAQGL